MYAFITTTLILLLLVLYILMLMHTYLPSTMLYNKTFTVLTPLNLCTNPEI